MSDSARLSVVSKESAVISVIAANGLSELGRRHIERSLGAIREAVSQTDSGEQQEPCASLKPFHATCLNEVPLAQRAAVVQRVIETESVTALVGIPNGGKTALAVDLAVHVAANSTWFGLKVTGGPVIYFAAEAPGSVHMRARAAAARKFPDRRLPLYLVTEPPLLGGEVTSLVDSERIILTVRAVESTDGEAVKLVVIDTLAAALGDGDENGDGMLRLVAAAKSIALETGAAVAIVHHPSKGDAAGLRGHGSLPAACDAILVIAANELSGERTVTLTKSRDSASGLQLAYELESVALPEPDSFGDPRTTIIVKQVSAPRQQRPRPSGKQQGCLLDELERRHRAGEHGWDEATVRAAARGIGMTYSTASSAKDGLIRSGYLSGSAARLTLRYPPED